LRAGKRNSSLKLKEKRKSCLCGKETKFVSFPQRQKGDRKYEI
jgi:hypothetical protein